MMPALLNADEKLLPGQQLDSPNKQYRLVLQHDGNIVLYGNRALWSSQTSGYAPGQLVNQSDGNIVLYGTDQRALWSSETLGSPVVIQVQDDGNLVIYRDGNPLASTSTRGQI